MNYCFLARGTLEVYSPKIFLDIRNRYDKNGVGYFVVMNSHEAERIKKLVPDGITLNVSDYIKNHWDELSLKRLSEFEKKYDCAPMWKYIYTDRYLIERDYEYSVKMTAGLFSFFDYVFNKYKIDFYYSEVVATLLCYTAFLVGKKTGTRYYAQTGAHGKDATHHFIMNNALQYAMGFDENYKNKKYENSEIEEAERFLSNFENKEILPSFMSWTYIKPKFKLSFVILPFLRLAMSFNSDLTDPYSYMYYKSYKHITDPLTFYFRYLFSKKYYKNADYNRKYVYFPLHYQPEATTIVCAQKYEKQLYYIDSWAKSLPADTVLYVKEHYALLGNRDTNFYKELKKYPNVVLISPWENSRKLILNSVAVTTLTGTAGWEAFLLHKPVFVGGDIFYNNAPGVIKVDDIYGNYLDVINNWKQPSREDVLKYLCEYFRCIKPGIQSGYGSDKSDIDENIHKVVDSLMQVMK